MTHFILGADKRGVGVFPCYANQSGVTTVNFNRIWKSDAEKYFCGHQFLDIQDRDLDESKSKCTA
jgi:hypothetical protein